MDSRLAPLAPKLVPGEFSTVKHVRGVLSLARHSDPASGGSSFSILLGDAPHLDGEYAVFGKLTAGDEVLSALEKLPTKTEGIFVMPLERITILSSYVYDVGDAGDDDLDEGEGDVSGSGASAEARCCATVSSLRHDLQKARANCLPG